MRAERVVLEKLDFLIRFWELKARHSSTETPLEQHEQRELLSLLQLVTGDLRVPTRHMARRLSGKGFPARWSGLAGARDVELVEVAAGGVVVRGVSESVCDQRAVLLVTDAIGGVEYMIPCVVAWRSSTGFAGLAPDGVPSVSYFEGTPSPVFGSASPSRRFQSGVFFHDGKQAKFSGTGD